MKNSVQKSSVQEFEFVLNECLKTPTRSKKIATTIKTKTETKPYTPDEALSFIIERKLTVDDYCTMQTDLKEKRFPSLSTHTFAIYILEYKRIVKLCNEKISET